MTTAKTTTKRTTAKKSDAQLILEKIAAGRVDEELPEIVNAVLDRGAGIAAPVAISWRFTAEGISVLEDELTVDECEQIEEALDTNWAAIRPWESAKSARVITETIFRNRLTLTPEEVSEKVRRLTARQLQREMFKREVYTAPLDSGD